MTRHERRDHHRQPSGTEPLTARSPLRLRAVLAGLALLIALHWDQTRTLVGQGARRADFRLRRKRRPLSWSTRAVLLGALPYAEEMRRCLRARPTLKAQPKADVPPERQVPAEIPEVHTTR